MLRLAIALLAPAVLLVLIEAVFRVCGYGYSSRFFEKSGDLNPPSPDGINFTPYLRLLRIGDSHLACPEFAEGDSPFDDSELRPP